MCVVVTLQFVRFLISQLYENIVKDILLEHVQQLSNVATVDADAPQTKTKTNNNTALPLKRA